jgi:toxin ParE1/3/4
MARIVVTEPADADLATIIAYLAGEAGLATAEQYLARFDALYQRLARFPASGARRPALGQAVRIGVVPPYIVIHEYDAERGTVFILRVVHGRREITGALLGR